MKLQYDTDDTQGTGVKQAYIGDGVYAEHDRFGVTLYTDRSGGRHGDTRHWIYLEPAVFAALVRFVETVEKELDTR
jgi:hypothetical protein